MTWPEGPMVMSPKFPLPDPCIFCSGMNAPTTPGPVTAAPVATIALFFWNVSHTLPVRW